MSFFSDFFSDISHIVLCIIGCILPVIILSLQWKFPMPYGLVPYEEMVFGGSVFNIIIVNIAIFIITYICALLLIVICPNKTTQGKSIGERMKDGLENAMEPAGILTGITCCIMIIPWLFLTLGEEDGAEIPVFDEILRFVLGNMIGQCIVFGCVISPVLKVWYDGTCKKDDKK